MKEEQYEAALCECAERICRDSRLRLVMLAGGSCSGKTTTTQKLAGLLRSMGREVSCVSLDDYYRNPENAVYTEDGKQDTESIRSLRLDLLQDTMLSIVRGEPAVVPFFDFTQHRRVDAYRVLQPAENSITLVEGLHALNPVICPSEVPGEDVFRIYLYVQTDDGTDGRFLRRLVRDSRHRATDAAGTYERWATVLAAEHETILPFVPLADRSINTYFDYEKSILADDAIALLRALPTEHASYVDAQKLIASLEGVPLLPDSVIPKDSLLREFI